MSTYEVLTLLFLFGTFLIALRAHLCAYLLLIIGIISENKKYKKSHLHIQVR